MIIVIVIFIITSVILIIIISAVKAPIMIVITTNIATLRCLINGEGRGERLLILRYLSDLRGAY